MTMQKETTVNELITMLEKVRDEGHGEKKVMMSDTGKLLANEETGIAFPILAELRPVFFDAFMLINPDERDEYFKDELEEMVILFS